MEFVNEELLDATVPTVGTSARVKARIEPNNLVFFIISFLSVTDLIIVEE